jgi:hypothetical protein
MKLLPTRAEQSISHDITAALPKFCFPFVAAWKLTRYNSKKLLYDGRVE